MQKLRIMCLSMSVQFRPLLDNIDDAFCKLKNTTTQIQGYVYSVVRGSVPKLDLDALYEQKNVIEKVVQEKLEKGMCAYGFEVLETLIVDIVPDETVKKAMNEAAAAKFKRCHSCSELGRD